MTILSTACSSCQPSKSTTDDGDLFAHVAKVELSLGLVEGADNCQVGGVIWVHHGFSKGTRYAKS